MEHGGGCGGDNQTSNTELTGPARPSKEPLQRMESNRTLLDIIREEGGGPKDNKKSWRSFKDKLSRRESGKGSTWTSSVRIPASDIPINNNNNNRMMSRNPSTRMSSNMDLHAMNQPNISAVPDARTPSLLRNSSISMERPSGRFDPNTRLSMRKLQREENSSDEEEDEEGDRDEGSGGESMDEGKDKAEDDEEEEKRPVKMSLMSLLAETDDDGLAYGMDEEDDDEDDEEDGGGGGSVEYSNCCVCMVRHKGTGFEPCGHSFCRLCSRELGVQSGKCPLCNNYILEILDIF